LRPYMILSGHRVANTSKYRCLTHTRLALHISTITAPCIVTPASRFYNKKVYILRTQRLPCFLLCLNMKLL
jgi:hypothetical protein